MLSNLGQLTYELENEITGVKPMVWEKRTVQHGLWVVSTGFEWLVLGSFGWFRLVVMVWAGVLMGGCGWFALFWVVVDGCGSLWMVLAHSSSSMYGKLCHAKITVKCSQCINSNKPQTAK